MRYPRSVLIIFFLSLRCLPCFGRDDNAMQIIERERQRENIERQRRFIDQQRRLDAQSAMEKIQRFVQSAVSNFYDTDGNGRYDAEDEAAVDEVYDLAREYEDELTPAGRHVLDLNGDSKITDGDRDIMRERLRRLEEADTESETSGSGQLTPSEKDPAHVERGDF